MQRRKEASLATAEQPERQQRREGRQNDAFVNETSTMRLRSIIKHKRRNETMTNEGERWKSETRERSGCAVTQAVNAGTRIVGTRRIVHCLVSVVVCRVRSEIRVLPADALGERLRQRRLTDRLWCVGLTRHPR